MGADLILAHLWMSEGRAPDWTAAERAVDEVPVDDLRSAYASIHGLEPDQVDLDEEELRDMAREFLGTAKLLWDGKMRTCCDVSIPGVSIMAVGDRTWGNSIEEVDAVHFLAGAGVLQAAGFFEGDLRALFRAAQDVVDRWERGDLAEAVRRLSRELRPFSNVASAPC